MKGTIPPLAKPTPCVRLRGGGGRTLPEYQLVRAFGSTGSSLIHWTYECSAFVADVAEIILPPSSMRRLTTYWNHRRFELDHRQKSRGYAAHSLAGLSHAVTDGARVQSCTSIRASGRGLRGCSRAVHECSFPYADGRALTSQVHPAVRHRALPKTVTYGYIAWLSASHRNLPTRRIMSVGF